MTKGTNIINFLNELNSRSTKSTFKELVRIIEELENKNDPDPIEMEIVNVGYQLLEKLKLMDAVLQRYNHEGRILTGNKLDDLYDNTSNGTSTLFD